MAAAISWRDSVSFPTVVIAEILGVIRPPCDFRRWSEHMVLAVFEPMSPEQRCRVGERQRDGCLPDVVFAERLGSTEEDMVSLLLRAELEGGALTRQELGVFVATLLVAGSITTAYLIGSAVMQLAQEPRLLGAVRADPTLVGAVVEETLRHQSPIQMMFRTETSDIDIAGTTIPNNATVLALLGSANRDEQMFTNPDSFDIRRPVGESLSFGHGVHYCLGAALARMEASVALQEILRAAAVLEPPARWSASPPSSFGVPRRCRDSPDAAREVRGTPKIGCGDVATSCPSSEHYAPRLTSAPEPAESPPA
jgi:cytochrome P450